MSENSSTRMSAEEKPSTGPGEQAIVVTRIIDAPRPLVFKAWTEPERLKRWWGPRGFTASVIETDLRVGGKYPWGMRSPDGQEIFTTGVYREIVEPERIVVTESFADADGNVVPASHYGMSGDWPPEVIMTVTLEEQGRQDRDDRAGGGHPEGDAGTG